MYNLVCKQFYSNPMQYTIIYRLLEKIHTSIYNCSGSNFVADKCFYYIGTVTAKTQINYKVNPICMLLNCNYCKPVEINLTNSNFF